MAPQLSPPLSSDFKVSAGTTRAVDLGARALRVSHFFFGQHFQLELKSTTAARDASGLTHGNIMTLSRS
jgi:hypothetical protein